MYIADGDYIKDIEVNDLRNKYTLTKGPTQKLVNISATPTDTLRLSLLAFPQVQAMLVPSFYILWRTSQAYIGLTSTLQTPFGIC